MVALRLARMIAPDPDAEKLAAAILTRRRIKCERVNGNHTDGGCKNCGTK